MKPTLHDLKTSAAECRDIRDALAEAEAKRDAILRANFESGATAPELMEAAQVSRPRIYQILHSSTPACVDCGWKASASPTEEDAAAATTQAWTHAEKTGHAVF